MPDSVSQCSMEIWYISSLFRFPVQSDSNYAVHHSNTENCVFGMVMALSVEMIWHRNLSSVNWLHPGGLC